MVLGIVKSHDGAIAVKSSVGQGTELGYNITATTGAIGVEDILTKPGFINELPLVLSKYFKH
ncbi:MAG: hypothetical protein ABL958_12060 [Bdellovibrionia bacterium]